MSIVPRTDLGKITFYEAHIDDWTLAPTTIGLVAADCTALAQLITTARQAYDDQQKALATARSATLTMHLAVLAMHAAGSADIAKIKAFADATHNLNVFALANIPAPATPAPVGPPGTPTDFVVTLAQSGAVVLKWKCANPVGASGTVYEVQRKSGSGTFAVVGTAGSRTFTDASLPNGASGVVYQITGIRSTLRGMPAQFNVNFGIGGDGVSFATVSAVTGGNGPQMKMAA